MTSSWSPYLHENDTRQDEEEGQPDIHRRPPHPKERVRSKMFTDKLRRISPVHLCKMKVFLGFGLEFPSSLMYKTPCLSITAFMDPTPNGENAHSQYSHASEWIPSDFFVCILFLFSHSLLLLFFFIYLFIYFFFFGGGGVKNLNTDKNFITLT